MVAADFAAYCRGPAAGSTALYRTTSAPVRRDKTILQHRQHGLVLQQIGHDQRNTPERYLECPGELK